MATEKIGLDFHGVVNEDPEFFRRLADVAMAAGIEVHIISGGPRETVKKYLLEHQIPYSRLWCIFDFYNQKNKVTFAADGSFHVDDDLWNKAKAEYCDKEGILFHIDDSPIYGRYFKLPYYRYDAKTKSCVFADKCVTLEGDALTVLEKLLQIRDS